MRGGSDVPGFWASVSRALTYIPLPSLEAGKDATDASRMLHRHVVTMTSKRSSRFLSFRVICPSCDANARARAIPVDLFDLTVQVCGVCACRDSKR